MPISGVPDDNVAVVVVIVVVFVVIFVVFRRQKMPGATLSVTSIMNPFVGSNGGGKWIM